MVSISKRRKIAIATSVIVSVTIIAVFGYQLIYNNFIEWKIADLYRDILHRSPDSAGMNYYREEIINNGKSLQWVEESLRNSQEAKLRVEIKTIGELKDETKKIIDDLYREILYRPADELGMAYFGSMLESGKLTAEDIKKALLESDEYKAMQ